MWNRWHLIDFLCEKSRMTCRRHKKKKVKEGYRVRNGLQMAYEGGWGQIEKNKGEVSWTCGNDSRAKRRTQTKPPQFWERTWLPMRLTFWRLFFHSAAFFIVFRRMEKITSFHQNKGQKWERRRSFKPSGRVKNVSAYFCKLTRLTQQGKMSDLRLMKSKFVKVFRCFICSKNPC